jgi:hypothetical protein
MPGRMTLLPNCRMAETKRGWSVDPLTKGEQRCVVRGPI